MKYEYFTDYTEIIVYWAIFVAICLALIIIIPDPNLSFQRVYRACSRGGASRSAPVCGSTLSAMALHERPGFVRFPDDPSRIRFLFVSKRQAAVRLASASDRRNYSP